MTKWLSTLGLVGLLAAALWLPEAEAARFRRLSYNAEAQFFDGAVVAEDRVSYYIVGTDGREKCYSKRGIEVLASDSEEDAAILAHFGYGQEALASYAKAKAATHDPARQAEIDARILALPPMLKNRATLQQLAAAYPEAASVEYWLGRSYLVEGRYAEASQHMLRAATLDRATLDYRIGLAEARLWLAQAALLARQAEPAREILAEIPYSASVDEQVRWLARDDFRARLERPGSAALLEYDPCLFLGRYLVDTRLYALAGPYLWAASDRHPQDPVVHNYLAHVFLDLGRTHDAELEMRCGDANPANHPPDRERTERLAAMRRAYEAQRMAMEERQRVALRQREEAARQAVLGAATDTPKEPPLEPGKVRISN